MKNVNASLARLYSLTNFLDRLNEDILHFHYIYINLVMDLNLYMYLINNSGSVINLLITRFILFLNYETINYILKIMLNLFLYDFLVLIHVIALFQVFSINIRDVDVFLYMSNEPLGLINISQIIIVIFFSVRL